MRLRFRLIVLALALVAGAGLIADETPATPAKVWRLDDAAKVDGHTATVLGSPRVIDVDGGKAVYFDGAADGLLLPVNPLQGLTKFTIEVLFNPADDGAEEQRFFHVQDTTENRALLEIRLKNGQWALDSFLRSESTAGRLALLDRTKLHPANRWTWVAMVYSNGHMAHFINGVKELEGEIKFPPMGPGQISLGMRQNKVFWFKGSIREVRFHPAALEPEALQGTPTGK